MPAMNMQRESNTREISLYGRMCGEVMCLPEQEQWNIVIRYDLLIL